MKLLLVYKRRQLEAKRQGGVFKKLVGEYGECGEERRRSIAGRGCVLDIRARRVEFDGNLGILGSDSSIPSEFVAQALYGLHKLSQRVGIRGCDTDDKGLQLRFRVGHEYLLYPR